MRDDSIFQRGENVTRLDKWFAVQDHCDFPIINPHEVSHSTIAFTNGLVDVQAWKFYETGHADIPSDLVTFHYFEVEFGKELEDKPTPHWDKLIGHQLRDPDLKEQEQTDRVSFFEAFIGRLFVPVGFDNWQRWPFLLGEANTGKSTVLNLLAKAFPPNSVGFISNNFERQFGLENMDSRRLLILPDAPEELDRLVPRELLQSMICGESVPIARKHKAAGEAIQWTVPGIMAANRVYSWGLELLFCLSSCVGSQIAVLS